MAGVKILHNVHGSNFANFMIKYIVAEKASIAIGGAALSNYRLPDWGIDFPEINCPDIRQVDFKKNDQEINLDCMSYLFESGLVDRINIHGHLQRMENFPPKQEASRLLKADENLGMSFGSEYLVCPVRGGEILEARHTGYTLIPINFYADIIRETQLKPVFMGQIDSNPYSDALRERFPSATYVPHQGVVADFQTIRKSKNILLSVSTFSWLAAWLSDANNIIMPVYGIFHPIQHADIDLLPLGDSRYHFYQFPVHGAVPVNEVADNHKHLDGRWLRVSPQEILRSFNL